MFLCGYCNKQSAPGEKLTMVPDKIRRRNYEVDGKVYQGTEIIREKKSCVRCVAEVAVKKEGS